MSKSEFKQKIEECLTLSAQKGIAEGRLRALNALRRMFKHLEIVRDDINWKSLYSHVLFEVGGSRIAMLAYNSEGPAYWPDLYPSFQSEVADWVQDLLGCLETSEEESPPEEILSPEEPSEEPFLPVKMLRSCYTKDQLAKLLRASPWTIYDWAKGSPPIPQDKTRLLTLRDLFEKHFSDRPELVSKMRDICYHHINNSTAPRQDTEKCNIIALLRKQHTVTYLASYIGVTRKSLATWGKKEKLPSETKHLTKLHSFISANNPEMLPTLYEHAPSLRPDNGSVEYVLSEDAPRSEDVLPDDAPEKPFLPLGLLRERYKAKKLQEILEVSSFSLYSWIKGNPPLPFEEDKLDKVYDLFKETYADNQDLLDQMETAYEKRLTEILQFPGYDQWKKRLQSSRNKVQPVQKRPRKKPEFTTPSHDFDSENVVGQLRNALTYKEIADHVGVTERCINVWAVKNKIPSLQSHQEKLRELVRRYRGDLLPVLDRKLAECGVPVPEEKEPSKEEGSPLEEELNLPSKDLSKEEGSPLEEELNLPSKEKKASQEEEKDLKRIYLPVEIRPVYREEFQTAFTLAFTCSKMSTEELVRNLNMSAALSNTSIKVAKTEISTWIQKGTVHFARHLEALIEIFERYDHIKNINLAVQKMQKIRNIGLRTA